MSIYEWTNVPKEVNWIATDGDSRNAFGWKYEPVPDVLIGQWEGGKTIKKVSLTNYAINANSNPFKGNWKESLEQRPVEIKEPSHG